jgi:hypothetical protein
MQGECQVGVLAGVAFFQDVQSGEWKIALNGTITLDEIGNQI